MTDRKNKSRQPEINLNYSEEIYHLITDNAFDMILLLDLNAIYLYSNKSVEEKLGYTQKELVGCSVFDFIHQDDREEMLQLLSEGLANKRTYARFLVRIKHCNGNYRWVDHKAKFLKTVTGEQDKILINAQDLTEQLESEKILEESREWYRTIAEDIPALVTRITPDYIITFVNNTYSAFFGKPVASIIGDKLSNYIPPEKYFLVIEHFSALTPEQPVATIEHTNTAHDNSEHWIRWTNRAFFDSDGRVKEYLNIGEDITQYKRAFQLLKESESMKSSIIEASPDLIICNDTEGRYLNILSNNDDLLYRPREEMLGKKMDQVLPRELAKKITNTIQKAVSTGELQRMEFTLETKAGTYDLESRIKASGKDEVISYNRDITEQKRLENELRESEEKYKEILASIEEGYYEVDLAGKISYCNDATLRMIGYSREELIGMSYKLLYKDPEPVFHTFNRVFLSGKPDRGFTLEMLRKDGSSLYGELSVSLIRDKNGSITGFRGVARDITERILFENKLKYLSMHDQLTGLHNRAYFEEEMIRLSKSRDYPITIISIDLDDLKMVNDSLGHAAGDELLKTTAGILKDSVRGSDILARIGGDEFTAILPETDEETGERIAARIRKNISEYNKKEVNLSLGLSLGLATANNQKDALTDVFKKADDYMYHDKLSSSNQMRNKTVETLLIELAKKDYITEGHTQRLANLCQRIGEKINLSSGQLSDLALLAQVHDLGKVGIPDSIFYKKGKLTEEEWKTMRLHPEKGYRIAITSPNLSGIADLILKHHELWDGSGYPLGLQGNDIAIECRILAIIDAYDAMINDRSYSNVKSNQAALKEIKKYAGSQFDPELVEVFVNLIGEG